MPFALLISAKFRNGSGEFVGLPSWLNLDSKGILTSEAKNEHVGIYTLRVKAVDPLGGEIQQDVQLEIGNINQNGLTVSFENNSLGSNFLWNFGPYFVFI